MLSVRAKNEVLGMLRDVEELVAFPSQALCSVGPLIGKPKGGERVVCILAALAKLWARVRRRTVVAWEAAKAGFWDGAVKGCYALRAVLLRR